MVVKEKDYLSTREVAELLNVAVSTIQLWMDNGLLAGWSTAGGHRRIAKSSVEKMLNQRHHNTSTNINENKISIVVVEENKQEQMLYEQQFEIWDMDVNFYIANDGYAGLLNIGKLSPAIIITNLIMPDMNGFEIINAIKKNPDLKYSQVIAVSALTKDEIKIRGGLPDDVLVYSKPMPFNELEVIIRNLLRLNFACS